MNQELQRLEERVKKSDLPHVVNVKRGFVGEYVRKKVSGGKKLPGLIQHHFLGPRPLLRNKAHKRHVIVRPHEGRFKRLKQEARYPTLPELATEHNLNLYIDILNATVSQQEFEHSVSDEVINFVTHYAQLILSAEKKHKAQVPPALLYNTRRFLQRIETYQSKSRDETGQPKWLTNSAESFDPEDTLAEGVIPIPEIDGFGKHSAEVRQLLAVDLESTNPLARYNHIPAQYERRYDNLHHTRYPDKPHVYRERWQTALELAQLKKRGGIRQRIKGLLRCIEWHLQDNTDSARIQRVQDIDRRIRKVLERRNLWFDEPISVTQFERKIQQNFLDKLPSLDWDTMRDLGEAVLVLLEHSTLTIADDSDAMSYAPYTRAVLSPQDKTLLTNQLRTYAEEYLGFLEGAEVAKRVPDYYRWMWVMYFFVLIGFYPAREVVDSATNLSPQQIVDEFSTFITYVASGEWLERFQDTEVSEFIAENFPGMGEVFGDEGEYRGPQNSVSLAELKDRMQPPIYTVLQGVGDNVFYPNSTVRYHLPNDSGYAVEWNGGGEYLYSMGINTYSLNYEVMAESTSKSTQRETFFTDNPTFEDALSDESEEVDFSGHDSASVVQKIYMDFSDQNDKEIFIPIPLGANQVALLHSGDTVAIEYDIIEDFITHRLYLQLKVADFPSGNKESSAILYFLTGIEYALGDNGLKIQRQGMYNVVRIDAVRQLLPIQKETLTEVVNPTLVDFVQQWGIDFDRIDAGVQTALQESVEQEDETLDRLLTYRNQVRVRNTATFEQIATQLREREVKYSTNMIANSLLDGNDYRAYFLVGETVGLDCDSLAFLINLIAQAYVTEKRTYEYENTVTGALHTLYSSSIPAQLVLGEADINSDNWATGYVNHARLSVNADMHDTFEATAYFPVSNTVSEEEVNALNASLELYGIEGGVDQPISSDFKRFLVFGTILTGVLATPSLLFAFNQVRRIKLDIVKEAYDKVGGKLREKFNGRLLLKLIPRLSQLSDSQLVQLTELMSYLSNEHMAPEMTEKNGSIEDFVEIYTNILKSYSATPGGVKTYDYSNFGESFKTITQGGKLEQVKVSAAIRAIGLIQRHHELQGDFSKNRGWGERPIPQSHKKTFYQSHPRLEGIEVSPDFLKVLDALKILLRFRVQ